MKRSSYADARKRVSADEPRPNRVGRLPGLSVWRRARYGGQSTGRRRGGSAGVLATVADGAAWTRRIHPPRAIGIQHVRHRVRWRGTPARRAAPPARHRGPVRHSWRGGGCDFQAPAMPLRRGSAARARARQPGFPASRRDRRATGPAGAASITERRDGGLRMMMPMMKPMNPPTDIPLLPPTQPPITPPITSPINTGMIAPLLRFLLSARAAQREHLRVQRVGRRLPAAPAAPR